MSDTGRYHISYLSGRKYTVEPIAERNQKEDDCVFYNGGYNGTAAKNKSSIKGGSIRAEDSTITAENGYKRWITLPPGHSPEGFIEALEACKTQEERDALWDKYGAEYAP
jgi:hypothetical protein